MPKRFNILWYQKETSVHRACLFNLRDSDLADGGQIREGEIIAGRCGFSVAEAAVLGFSGQICEYLPNRCVDWQGHFLTCMALDDLPTGKHLQKTGKPALRHKHYVVAEFNSSSLIRKARGLGLPVIRSKNGRYVANLEIFTVPGRTPACRRAKLF